MELSNTDGAKAPTIIKKPKTKKSLRLKKISESDDQQSEEEELDRSFISVIEDAKDIRKLRRRPNGVNAVGLALGKKLTTEEELIIDDPFKLKTGGFVDMKALKGRGKSGMEELDAVDLGNTFSAETNRRDEDADMMKYIEEELYKRKGSMNIQQKKEIDAEPRKADDVLFEVPEHLRQSSSKRSEEMLSNQMLSGIPEVDLGIDERIRNIEATEEAKHQLLKERMRKKEKSMSFVPTNMAVNFVQHNRFNIDENDQPKAKRLKESKPELIVAREVSPVQPVIPGKVPKTTKGKAEDEEKATDDFHFEKFKKQFRRF